MPNNPDGFDRVPVYTNSNVVYDLVYYWPHLEPTIVPQDASVLIFSFTKLSGHASNRFGWAFVKDPAIARSMGRFIYEATLMISVDSTLRALQVFKYLNLNVPIFS